MIPLDAALSALPSAAFTFDREDKLVHANQAAATLVDEEASALVGRPLASLFVGGDLLARVAECRRSRAGATVPSLGRVRRGGKELSVGAGMLAPIFDGDDFAGTLLVVLPALAPSILAKDLGRYSPAAVSVTPPPQGAPDRPRARILCVDDEPMILASLRRLLQNEYDVTGASSGIEALGLLERGAHFDLVICDLMMPHMTGMDLFARMTERFPAVAERVVFLTGGAFTPKARQFLAEADRTFLEKPIDSHVLRKLIAERTARAQVA